MNKLVVTSIKLTNNFAGGPGYKLSRAGCGPRAACWITLVYTIENRSLLLLFLFSLTEFS
jgi:hypothetical protein